MTAERTCLLPECKRTWVPRDTPVEQIYCSRSCASKASSRRPDVRARLTAKQTAKRNATTGRVCKYCKRDDKGKQFATPTVCTRCARAQARSSCDRCGGPFYVVAVGARRATGCLVRAELPPGFDCRDEV